VCWGFVGGMFLFLLYWGGCKFVYIGCLCFVFLGFGAVSSGLGGLSVGKRLSREDFRKLLDVLIQDGPRVEYRCPDKWGNY